MKTLTRTLSRIILLQLLLASTYSLSTDKKSKTTGGFLVGFGEKVKLSSERHPPQQEQPLSQREIFDKIKRFIAGQRRKRKRRKRRRRRICHIFPSSRRRLQCQCTNIFGCLMHGGRIARSCQMFSVCCQFPPKNNFNTDSNNEEVKSGRSLEHLNMVEEKEFRTTDRETCGISMTEAYAQSKIMGGLDAGYGQFPWTALIKIASSRPIAIDKTCGGTLINARWVITAGHCTHYCVTDVTEYGHCRERLAQSQITYKILMGVYDQFSDDEFPDIYYAVDIIRHPEYRNVIRVHVNGFVESEPRYDIALMLLDRPVRSTPNVGAICLPSGLDEFPGNHELATVVGWGRTGRDEGSPHSRVLQAVTVPILTSEECRNTTGLGTFPDQLCAGGIDTEQSACPGDSGGGLQQLDVNERWTLIGIVSNGPSTCGLQPVVYHKLSHTISWALRVMEQRMSLKLP